MDVAKRPRIGLIGGSRAGRETSEVRGSGRSEGQRRGRNDMGTEYFRSARPPWMKRSAGDIKSEIYHLIRYPIHRVLSICQLIVFCHRAFCPRPRHST